MSSWSLLVAVLLAVTSLTASHRGAQRASTECNHKQFDTCTKYLSKHINQVRQQQQAAPTADDAFDTTMPSDVSTPDVITPRVQVMPMALRLLLNSAQTVKVERNRTPTGSASEDAVTSLKLLLSAIEEGHNVEKIFEHLLDSTQEEPLSVSVHDLICRMLEHDGAPAMPECITAQPQCLLGPVNSATTRNEQAQQQVRVLNLARDSCQPGCEQLTQQLQSIAYNCSAFQRLAPLLTLQNVTSSQDLPANLTCGTLREATSCVMGEVRQCDVIHQAYVSFVDTHMVQVMEDCGVEYKIPNDAADVWASYYAAAIVPVIVLRNTLARSWLSATTIYGTFVMLYNLVWI